jgi:acetylornithine/N-succinyldiaminopimelate aminotransferase
LEKITKRTACVIAETVQAEAGVLVPQREWLAALRRRCEETGALLVLDEIQCAFGRNGSLWAFEKFGVVPDILLLGKALGGGMPLGAFVTDKKIMDALTSNPVLGHINTFGGHPVCCAAGLAAFDVLLEENLVEEVLQKEELFLSMLHHHYIKAVRSCGLMLAVEFRDFAMNKRIIDALIDAGVFTDWFLFASNCLRIVPPLVITREEITSACNTLLRILDEFSE